MRVISGWARGKKLESIKSPHIRPTTDRVKEAIFNIIQFNILNSSFLDLFGGTGQIGIEALSRGAKKVIIVDNNNDSLKTIKKNISGLKSDSDLQVINDNAYQFLEKTELKFDIAFLDPPYNSEILSSIFSYMDKIMNPNSIVIVETSSENNIPKETKRFKFKRSYEYGRILISIYTDDSI